MMDYHSPQISFGIKSKIKLSVFVSFWILDCGEVIVDVYRLWSPENGDM